ncbi:cell division cycle 5-like protein [Nannochloropsis oceanica]
MFAFMTGNGKKRSRGSGSSGSGGWFGGGEDSSGGKVNVQTSSLASAGAASGTNAGNNKRHLSEIERRRQDSIRENQEFIKQLGLTDVLTGMREEQAPAAARAASAPSLVDGDAGRQARGGPFSISAAPTPTLEQVKAKWVGREAQIKLLARLLPSVEEPCSSSSVLLVHGPSGGGKTGVVADVLRSCKLPHALIRGVEHPTARSLYSTIAATWLRHVEMQAQALGLEGVGYMEVDEFDDDRQREYRVLARRERREARQRQRQLRKQGKGRMEEEEVEGGEDEGGTSGGSEGYEDDEEEDEEEEDDDDEDPYYAQRSSVQQVSAGVGAATGSHLIPLPNRCATAAGLLHLLRSWRGTQQQQPQQQQSARKEGSVDLYSTFAGGGGGGGGGGAAATGTVPFIIVLDSADRLPRGASFARHELAELPAMLAGPQGKDRHNPGHGGAGAVVALTVILISETPVVVPGSLEAALALNVPFPAYTKVQATAILLRSLRVAAGLPPSPEAMEGGREEGEEEREFESLVAGFVNVLVASLYSSTRDVREMRRMAVLLSEKYLEPVLAKGGREEEEEKGKENQAERRSISSGGGREGGKLPGHLALFDRVRPLIQRAVHSCLHMPAEPLEKSNSLPPLPPSLSSSSSSSSSPFSPTISNGVQKSSSSFIPQQPHQQEHQHQALLRYELPKMALYLLLASFLASHVSPNTDLQLFAVKSSSSSSSSTTTRGTKRNKRTATAEDRAAEAQEAETEKDGARTFSLERLLSIFTCLVALTRASGASYANNTGTTELFAQINTLVRHRLLLRVRGGSGELGGMKFKCNVDEGLVRVVATDLEVALGHYLERGARG